MQVTFIILCFIIKYYFNLGAEELLIDQNAELDEERKQILNAIEEKRKKKVEEQKAAAEVNKLFIGVIIIFFSL